MNKELLQQARRLISSSAAMMDYLPHYPRSMGKVMPIDDEAVARIKQDLDKAASILKAIAQPVQPALPTAAQAVLDRWDSPQWEWEKHGFTADLMHALRKAIAQPVQPAERVPLTMEQIYKLWPIKYSAFCRESINFARAIEAAHGIKETK